MKLKKMAVDKDVALCVSCKNEVKIEHNALLCDGIGEIWFHANCVDIKKL